MDNSAKKQHQNNPILSLLLHLRKLKSYPQKPLKPVENLWITCGKMWIKKTRKPPLPPLSGVYPHFIHRLSTKYPHNATESRTGLALCVVPAQKARRPTQPTQGPNVAYAPPCARKDARAFPPQARKDARWGVVGSARGQDAPGRSFRRAVRGWPPKKAEPQAACPGNNRLYRRTEQKGKSVQKSAQVFYCPFVVLPAPQRVFP